MQRRSLSLVLPLLLLPSACSHPGQQPRELDDVQDTYCVVRPQAPPSRLPAYRLATLQDSALVRAQVGQLVLHVDSSRAADRPVTRALITLKEPSSVSSNPSAGGMIVASGQVDATGRVVLTPLPAGRYPGELLAWRFYTWTGTVDVRTGFTDTLRIGLSAKGPPGALMVARCRE